MASNNTEMTDPDSLWVQPGNLCQTTPQPGTDVIGMHRRVLGSGPTISYRQIMLDCCWPLLNSVSHRTLDRGFKDQMRLCMGKQKGLLSILSYWYCPNLFCLHQAWAPSLCLRDASPSPPRMGWVELGAQGEDPCTQPHRATATPCPPPLSALLWPLCQVELPSRGAGAREDTTPLCPCMCTEGSTADTHAPCVGANVSTLSLYVEFFSIKI